MLSIVLTAHNRKRQVLNTLWSIEHTRKDFPIEVILVDDNSVEVFSPEEFKSFSFHINYHIRKDRMRQDPVIPNNIGFSMVTGDAVLINCGEVAHTGNIIEHTFNNLTDQNYLCYGVYSIDKLIFDQINTFDWTKPEVLNQIKNIVTELSVNYHEAGVANGWYIHSTYRPLALPFCSAISRTNLEKLSGYDERFQFGAGGADVDFLRRVNDLGLITQVIDNPLTIHQPHQLTDYTNRELVVLNNNLVIELTQTHNIKATENIIYRR